MKRVFIDGSAGTTGLRIYDRLKERDDISLFFLEEKDRKNTEKRKEALNSADIAFLCLPDAAAKEAAELVENDSTVVIDTSTIHRTSDGWAYGFPELGGEFEEKIRYGKRIAVPGCHAGGFIALVYPLIKEGFISPDKPLSAFSLTGYSGGGKKMISEYEDDELYEEYSSGRIYALGQEHKHLKEMKKITGLNNFPVFIPTVGNYYSGMLVSVPLFQKDLAPGKSFKDIKDLYRSFYKPDGLVSYGGEIDINGFIASNSLSGCDNMLLSVGGNEERAVLYALYDNLGKGASGAAIECLNLVTGKDKKYGLNVRESI